MKTSKHYLKPENLGRYARYYVSVNGIDKYPVWNKEHNFHKPNVKRYANIGNNHLLPEINDLPSDGYPYTIEWSTNRYVY